jgi:hypothetical protein
LILWRDDNLMEMLINIEFILPYKWMPWFKGLTLPFNIIIKNISVKGKGRIKRQYFWFEILWEFVLTTVVQRIKNISSNTPHIRKYNNKTEVNVKVLIMIKLPLLSRILTIQTPQKTQLTNLLKYWQILAYFKDIKSRRFR